MASLFSEKKMLYDNLVQILNSFFLLKLLQAWYLHVFSHSTCFFCLFLFSKNSSYIIYQLEKVFFEKFFAFFSWMNLMTLLTTPFFSTSSWFNACFNFLMFLFLLCKLTTTFLIFIFSGKKSKSSGKFEKLF